MAKRNIGQEILESIRAIKQGEGRSYTPDISLNTKIIRERMELEPSAFASLLGVSLRTVQYWEKGKRKPSGPAQSLLLVAEKYPDILLDVLKKTTDHPIRRTAG